MQFVGHISNISQSDLDVLGQAFVQTYNNVVPSCPQDSFRTLLSATFFVDTLHNQGSLPSNLTNVLTLPFVLRMRASLLCKGCNENATLFFENTTTAIPSAAPSPFLLHLLCSQ
mmetsp:Transcript_26784/g.62234  ORF Transcript_26784/g.62234 Transcript_26784/m.62234 type:complete len:114 (+) Transcript_26784:1319-1660(+)